MQGREASGVAGQARAPDGYTDPDVANRARGSIVTGCPYRRYWDPGILPIGLLLDYILVLFVGSYVWNKKGGPVGFMEWCGWWSSCPVTKREDMDVFDFRDVLASLSCVFPLCAVSIRSMNPNTRKGAEQLLGGLMVCVARVMEGNDPQEGSLRPVHKKPRGGLHGAEVHGRGDRYRGAETGESTGSRLSEGRLVN